MFDERHPREAGLDLSSGSEAHVGQASELALVAQIESEKQMAEQRLQALIEEYETGQEELKASNEELQSANEELRSTLEELETSREELQSMNEELQTVNQENRHKVDELGQLSNDLQNHLTATDIATLFLDRELRILRFTPKISELFNIRMTDRGRPLSDLTHRLGYETLKEDAARVLERLVPIEDVAQDEVGRWYLTRVLPYRDADDRIAGVVVTFVEITRQKHAEETARVAKERSERIFAALPEPLLVLDTDLRIVSANAAFYEHFKVKPDHTIGRMIYQLGNNQWDIAALRHLLDNVSSENKTFRDYQVEHTFESIGSRVMLLNGRQLDDRTQILLGIHDITHRFRAEERLRASELALGAELAAMQRLHELVTRLLVAPDIDTALGDVLLTTMSLTGASKGYVQLFDAERRRLGIVVHHGFDQGFVDACRSINEDDNTACARALRSRRRVIIEDVASDPGYEPYRARAAAAGYRGVQATPLISRGGALLGMLTTHYAMRYRPSPHHLRLLELSTRQAADFVDRLRSDEALRLSEIDLGEQNRHKDEYLAMLGHELRNPLAAIRSATELIKLAATDDPKIGRAREALERQTSHVSRIIDGLLEVSRIARGKVSLVPKTLDVRTVIQRVVHDILRPIEERGLELTLDIGTDPLFVHGDESRLVQIFDNLLGNAVKFTNAPGSIHVGVEQQEASVMISVRDTGAGIRAEILPLIFEPFHQEAQDMARSKGGLGLGLSLVKGLVELHSGVVEARSGGPGLGATFCVRLPLTAPPAKTTASPHEADLSPRRIVIVEDDADGGEMLRELLELRNHKITLVSSAKAALEALRRAGADIVLCDLGLPDTSGYELARLIRADTALHGIRLVALTGYGQPEDRRRTAEAGFDHHLVKPVALRDLEAVLVAGEQRAAQ